VATPLDEESLRFILSIDPDLTKINEALKNLGKQVDTEGKKANFTNILLGALVGGQTGAGVLGQVAGAAGEAIGGPIGALIGEAAAKLVTKIPDALAGPARMAAQGVENLSKSLQGLQGPLGPVGVSFDLLGQTMKSIAKDLRGPADLFGPMFAQLARLPGIFKEITETLTSFAAKASPSQFKMFQIAVEDVQGVIGRTFLPVLELMREGVRLVGDALATFLPNMAEVRAALDPLFVAFRELQGALRGLMSEIGPVIRGAFIGALQLLGNVLAFVARAATIAVQGLRLLLDPLFKLAALVGFKPEFRSSIGAAARPVQFQGIQEYLQQIQASAFATPGVKSIPEQQLSTLQRIAALLEKMVPTGKPAPISNQVSYDAVSSPVADLMNWARGKAAQYGYNY
jgi:hypothetical protein